MIGKIVGTLILLMMGVFAIATFIIANEMDKYIDYPLNEDKDE